MVDVPEGFENAVVSIDLTWSPQVADLDLQLLEGNSERGASGNLPGLAEHISVDLEPGQHQFTIRVIPYSGAVADATITAQLKQVAPVAGLPNCTFGGAPTPETEAPLQLMRKLKAAAPQDRLGAYVYFSTGSRFEQDQLLAQNGLEIRQDFRDYSTAVFAAGPASGFLRLMTSDRVWRMKENQYLNFLGETNSWTTRVRVAQEAVAGGPYYADQEKTQILDGSGVTVTVLDSGLNATHPDFAGRVLNNYKVTGDFTGIFAPSHFEDVGYLDSDLTSGHGTHVAGTVGGSGAASTADYPDGTGPNVPGTFAGAAPNVSLQMYSVGDVVEPIGVAPVAALLWIDSSLQHMLYNLDQVTPRPRIASLSLGNAGGTDYDPADVTSCLVKALINEQVSVIWAAGNDGGDGQGADDNTSSMCKDPTPGVICVASYDDADTGSLNSTLSGFSSRGREGAPETYPDIAAPGSSITSTCTQGLQGQITCSTGAESRWAPLYGTISGTSMATPHVAGAVALLYQAQPTLTPEEVEKLIQRTARKVMTNGDYTVDPQQQENPADSSTWDDSLTTNFGFGAGLLNLQAALDDLGTPKAGTIPGSLEIFSGDADQAIQGAADVLALTMTDRTVNGVTGIEYRLTVRDIAATEPSPSGVRLTVEGYIDGGLYASSVLLDGAGAIALEAGEANNAAAENVSVEGNTVVFHAPYAAFDAPAEGTPIYNIRAYSTDVESGQKIDFAPSTSDAPGVLADQLPAHGRPFTVVQAAVSENDPKEACALPGTTVLNDRRGDIFAISTAVPPNPAVPFYDLRELSVAQPYVENAADYQLTFRLKMEGFPVVPTGTWPINFCSPAFDCVNPDSNTRAYGADNKYYTVEMTTLGNGTPAAPAFQIRQPTAAGTTTASRTVVPALAGEVLADGTILITVLGSDIGLDPALAGQQSLTKFQSRVSPAATTPDNMPDGLAGMGEFQTLPLDRCAPDGEENVAPVAEDGAATTQESNGVAITLVASDEDGDSLSYHVVAGPGSGQLSAVSGNQVVYTPNDGFTGADSFTFKANDGKADSNVATVSITVVENPDRDGDGVNNGVDNCPDLANADQANMDNDEHGDVCDGDIDGDGIANDEDDCPHDATNSCVSEEQIKAVLTSDTTGGAYDLVVNFDASGSTYVDDSAIQGARYTFVFGDGTDPVVQDTATISHTYTAAGTYKAYVVVTDENGEYGISETLTIRTTVSVDVGNPQPTVAALKADVTSGSAPLQVTFDGSDSVAAQDTSIVEWVFKFGDGNSRTVNSASAAAAVVYTYTTPGTFRPSLTVTDSDGGTDTTEAAAVKVADANGNVPEEVAPARKGGGSLGWLVLLPLMGAALRRRRLH